MQKQREVKSKLLSKRPLYLNIQLKLNLQLSREDYNSQKAVQKDITLKLYYNERKKKNNLEKTLIT